MAAVDLELETLHFVVNQVQPISSPHTALILYKTSTAWQRYLWTTAANEREESADLRHLRAAIEKARNKWGERLRDLRLRDVNVEVEGEEEIICEQHFQKVKGDLESLGGRCYATMYNTGAGTITMSIVIKQEYLLRVMSAQYTDDNSATWLDNTVPARAGAKEEGFDVPEMDPESLYTWREKDFEAKINLTPEHEIRKQYASGTDETWKRDMPPKPRKMVQFADLEDPEDSDDTDDSPPDSLMMEEEDSDDEEIPEHMTQGMYVPDPFHEVMEDIIDNYRPSEYVESIRNGRKTGREWHLFRGQRTWSGYQPEWTPETAPVSTDVPVDDDEWYMREFPERAEQIARYNTLRVANEEESAASDVPQELRVPGLDFPVAEELSRVYIPVTDNELWEDDILPDIKRDFEEAKKEYVLAEKRHDIAKGAYKNAKKNPRFSARQVEELKEIKIGRKHIFDRAKTMFDLNWMALNNCWKEPRFKTPEWFKEQEEIQAARKELREKKNARIQEAVRGQTEEQLNTPQPDDRSVHEILEDTGVRLPRGRHVHFAPSTTTSETPRSFSPQTPSSANDDDWIDVIVADATPIARGIINQSYQDEGMIALELNLCKDAANKDNTLYNRLECKLRDFLGRA